jgi:hypothetical protein
MTPTAPKKYSFVTIVAPAEVRAEFTVVREDLMTSDKQLMQALWNIAQRDMDAVRAEVFSLKTAASLLKASAKISKDEPADMSKAAKPKAVKEPKIKVAKEPKVKKAKEVKTVMFEGREEPEMFVGEEDDDMPCLVVNGL